MQRSAIFIVFLLLVFAVSASQVDAPVWETHGPFGQCCDDFVFHPAAPKLVIGAGGYGVYRSRDGGIQWTKSTLDGYLAAVRIDPSDPKRIVAATRNFWVSTDHGDTWQKVGEVPRCRRNGLNDFEIDPTNSSTWYAAINGGCSYKSTNGGGTWSSLVAATRGGFNEIEIHPNGKILYALQAVSGGRKVIKSTDSGNTWNSASAGLPASLGGPLKLVSERPDTLYIGGIALTTNGGRNWTTASCACTVVDFDVDPRNENVLYVTDRPGRLLKSTNAGASWLPITLPDIYWLRAGTVGISYENVLLVGSSERLMRSANGGKAWRFITSGPGGTSVFHITTSNKRAGLVFAAAPLGLFRSVSRGNSWQFVYRGLPPGFHAWDVEISPADPDIVAVIGTGYTRDTVFSGFGLSRDGGNTWAFQDLNFYPYVLGMDPLDPAILYIGTGGYMGVAKSTDFGKTWRLLPPAGLHSRQLITSMAIDPVDTSVIYLGTNSDDIYRSKNGGRNWELRRNGIPPANPSSYLIYSIQIDPSNTNTIYTATTEAVFKSTDAGLNWTRKDRGLPSGPSIGVLAIDPAKPSRLWAGRNPLYVSEDGAESWNLFPTDGLLGSPNEMKISIVPPGKLFLATDNGVFAYILP